MPWVLGWGVCPLISLSVPLTSNVWLFYFGNVGLFFFLSFSISRRPQLIWNLEYSLPLSLRGRIFLFFFPAATLSLLCPGCRAFFYPSDNSGFCFIAAAAAAKLLQYRPTLCNPRDGSPSGSAIPGILQARTLEWVAISFSNAWKWKVKSESEVAQSCPTLAIPWTAAYEAPPSMGFSRQKYWSGVPLPSPSVS